MTKRGWFLFSAVTVLWGIPYLFIKIAVEEVSPAFVAWSRVTLGAALLLPLSWRLGALRGLRPYLLPLAAFALLEIAIPFPLIAWGERYVSSSLTAILISSLPLIIALLALRFDHTERLDGIRLAGLVIGIGGVALLVGLDVGGRPRELLGAALILIATVGYAAGPLIVKRRLSDLHPMGSIAVALGLSGLMLVPAAAVSFPDTIPSGGVVAAIVVLGLACSATALALYFALITEVGAGRAAVITYVTPVVAVALGVLLLDERIGAAATAGVVLILAGSWLSTRGRPARVVVPEEPISSP